MSSSANSVYALSGCQLRCDGLDSALLSWPDGVLTIHQLLTVAGQLKQQLAWLTAVQVSEMAIQCRYDALHRSWHGVKKELLSALKTMPVADTHPKQPEKIRIPVCYHPSVAPDLPAVLAQCGVTDAEFIQLHSRVEYTVTMIGFAPGFGYLKGLPDELQLPRLKSPRVSVPRGSVAIAEQYSAIYPRTSPGGWHLVGKTPVCLFDFRQDSPCLLSPGSTVKFDAIELEEFLAMEQEFSKT